MKRIVLILIAVFCATTGSAYARGMKVTPDMLQMFRDIIKANQAADQQLYGDLERIADWLLKYNDRKGGLPSPSDNVVAIEQYLNGLLSRNPYRAEPLDPAKEEAARQAGEPQEEEPELPRVKLVFDYGLSVPRIDSLLQNPPAEWSATPGTAIIISNADKLALLVGAGSDQRPIKDHANGKVRAIIVQAP